jgi:quinohemoprotein ethanol dehydrogenase
MPGNPAMRCRRTAACAALLLGWATIDLAAHAAVEEGWLSVHGGLTNQRYVPFKQINHATIGRLGAVWISDPFADGATSRMTPVVRDGRMFFAAESSVYALDARTGHLLWRYRTETRKSTATGWQQMVTGLATTRSWGLGLGGGMVFVGLVNGHILALREESGAMVWDQRVNPEPLAIAQGVICTPLYVDGVLYLGLGMETTEGHAIAVDAQTGKVLWRVPTLAEPGQSGHETWPEGSDIWRSGGGHPWAAAAADPSLGLVYFVTGNASPPYGGQVRRGDNLFTVSLIALEMRSGKLRWYHQLIHHDVWEADLSVPPVLLEVKRGGSVRRAVAALRGDGYVFLFDRATGEPLIPLDERPVAQRPEVFTSATQPFPRGGDSILPPCESWRPRLPAGFVLGCMFDPASPKVPNMLAQWASVRIAPMAFDPERGYLYAQGQNSLLWRRVGDDPYLGDTNRHSGERIPNYPRATVIAAAIDTRTAKVIWRKELPSFDLSGYRADGGSLATGGGLVFHQGGDGSLQAWDAKTGQTLWRFQTDYALGDAPPMSYEIAGMQYVAFIAGSKVWAFALGGHLPQAPPIPPPPEEEVTGPIEMTHEIETLTLEQTPGNGPRYFLDEYSFNPYRAQIRAGSTVTFINNGHLPHTIVSQDGSWTTGTLGPTEIKTLSFDKPGRYLYSSKEYPWSYGQLIVTPAAAAQSPESQAALDQVERGRADYQASCALCHGQDLTGHDRTPALIGSNFDARWAQHDAAELFSRIKTTMPQTAPGSLDDATYTAIVAYLLAANDNAATVPLDPQSLMGVAVTK